MRRLLPAALLALAAWPALAAHAPYRLSGQTCDGLPRAPIGMVKGLCAGLVHQTLAGAPGPFMPRTLTPLDAAGRDWLVSDLGGWTPGRGALWRLRWPAGGQPAMARVLTGLSMPHTVAKGPDGGVYVGEMSRIFRFDPEAKDPAATITPVVTGLPDNRLHADRHPLSAFIFARDGALWVDVGAPSDACEAAESHDAQGRCTEGEGEAPKAAVRRYAYVGKGVWDAKFETVARGLRNSVALVQTPAGPVLQGENSIDFDDAASPHDEINLLRPGGFYGWPYCYDAGRTAPAFAKAPPVDCTSAAVQRPWLLLPPHAAPVAMAYARGPALPALNGRLLMTWRGFRPTGAKIAAFRTDGRGLPQPSPLILTPGWTALKGVRPRGAPAGLTVAPDGAIWVADDKNGAILRIARDRP